MALVFLDTEFTDLLAPELLSLGLVATGGDELYLELDLTSELGRARRDAASDFVQYGPVLEQWGQVSGAVCDYTEMARRAARWLLDQTARAGVTPGAPAEDRLLVAFDYATDFELLEYAIRDAGEGLWSAVREVVWPCSVGLVTDTMDGELEKERAYAAMKTRGLWPHHALADAYALRAAWLAVMGEAGGGRS